MGIVEEKIEELVVIYEVLKETIQEINKEVRMKELEEIKLRSIEEQEEIIRTGYTFEQVVPDREYQIINHYVPLINRWYKDRSEEEEKYLIYKINEGYKELKVQERILKQGEKKGREGIEEEVEKEVIEEVEEVEEINIEIM